MPTSNRKLASARANGSKSSGPLSPAGKAASSLNALTHGLTAQTVVLPNESRDQYEAELDHYLAHFDPRGKPEFDLVRQVAAAHWRLCRYAAVESSLFEHQMEQDQEWIDDHFDNVDDRRRVAIAFDRMSGPNSALSLLNRYQARLSREYRDLLRALETMQAKRIAGEPNAPNERQPSLPIKETNTHTEPSPQKETSPPSSPSRKEFDLPLIISTARLTTITPTSSNDG